LFDFASAFHVQKMKSGNPVVYLLREQFGSFAGSPHKADACDSIAGSLRQLGQVGEAAKWYEAAGALMYERAELRPELRALYAIEEYEKALECHTEMGDADAETDCSELLDGLRKACAPA
jgi:tetratricopeptide (TPR) repeat protein